MDLQGLLGVGRGVYKPCFLMDGLVMTQAVQNGNDTGSTRYDVLVDVLSKFWPIKMIL
jgi:hypothetical protein